MKPTVYLDATIPSFYYEHRPGTILQAWREITVEFLERARDRYELYVSDETLRELTRVRLVLENTLCNGAKNCAKTR